MTQTLRGKTTGADHRDADGTESPLISRVRFTNLDWSFSMPSAGLSCSSCTNSPIVISILGKRKPGLREVKWLAQGYTALCGWIWSTSLNYLTVLVHFAYRFYDLNLKVKKFLEAKSHLWTSNFISWKIHEHLFNNFFFKLGFLLKSLRVLVFWVPVLGLVLGRFLRSGSGRDIFGIVCIFA